jgi:DNA-binding LacI/PurR family transcriptional regulator
MTRTRIVTGADVARLAEVSKSAVSRAYNGGYVAPEVKERIFLAARKLRFRPSPAARALSTRRSRLIGLAITALDNQFYPELVDRLSDRLASSGYRLVLFTTRGDADLEPMLDELLGYHLDGVILASTSFAAPVAAECIQSGIPALMLVNTDPFGRIPGVSADNRAGCEAIAAHFVACGYEHIAVINGLEESSASIERTRHFCDALAALGRTQPRVISGQYTIAGTTAATRTLLQQPGGIDAIFCVTDYMAIACIQAARASGREPGRDLGIAGFDDAAPAAWPAFNLTTYAAPLADMIETSVMHLLAAIEGKPPLAGTRHLPGRLVVRGSTRKPV